MVRLRANSALRHPRHVTVRAFTAAFRECARLTWAPYHRFSRLTEALIRASADKRGPLLLVRISRPSQVDCIAEGTAALAAWPWLAVVLCMDRFCRIDDVARWARRAGRGSYYACVVTDGSTPLPPMTIAAHAKQGAPLPREVVRHVARVYPESDAELNESLTELLRPDAGFVSSPGLRRQLRRFGLPTPYRWHQLGRALATASRIQRYATSIERIALEAGYSDHADLSRQYLSLFGIRPSRLRNTVGWQWLTWRWLLHSRGAGRD